MEEIPHVVSSRIVFEGRVFRARVDELRYDDGTLHRCDIVEHAGSFGIIAMPSCNEILLVRQYRHPVGRYLWEIPAGTAEPGEDPSAGAARELSEETGYRAKRIRALGAAFVTPGFCNERMHFFAAEELSPGEQSLDEDERIAVSSFSMEQAWALAREGEIADVKTLLALWWMGGKQAELGSGTTDSL